MKTITFDDGYTVTISDRGLVTWKFQGKDRGGVHASHFKPVPDSGRAADYLQKNGKAFSDYLFACPSREEYLLRAGNGVREAIAEATEQGNRENEQRKAQAEAERAALIASERGRSGMKDPVPVRVEYYDGYPMSIQHDGRKLNPDWKTVCLGQLAFIERTELDALIARHDAAEKTKADAQAAKDAQIKSEFDSKLAKARSTGKPVVLSRWTTDRCMNHHDDQCSFDNATKYVLPDGTTKITYTCCYWPH